MPCVWDLLCIRRQKHVQHDIRQPCLPDTQADCSSSARLAPPCSDHHDPHPYSAGKLSMQPTFLGYQHEEDHENEANYQRRSQGDTVPSVQSSYKRRSQGDTVPSVQLSYQRGSQGDTLPSAQSSYQRRRSGQLPSDIIRDAVLNEGKRRHVRDIFADAPGATGDKQGGGGWSRPLSAGSAAPAGSFWTPGQSGEVRKRDSMSEYTPKLVNDDVISAVLMGSRVDDFVHDPSWNRNMHRFAVSPTSSFSSSQFFAVSSTHPVSSPPAKSGSDSPPSSCHTAPASLDTTSPFLLFPAPSTPSPTYYNQLSPDRPNSMPASSLHEATSVPPQSPSSPSVPPQSPTSPSSSTSPFSPTSPTPSSSQFFFGALTTTLARAVPEHSSQESDEDSQPVSTSVLKDEPPNSDEYSQENVTLILPEYSSNSSKQLLEEASVCVHPKDSLPSSSSSVKNEGENCEGKDVADDVHASDDEVEGDDANPVLRHSGQGDDLGLGISVEELFSSSGDVLY